MYESNQVHGLINSSEIKTNLDDWYQNNLMSYDEMIDGNAGFCNDRTPYSGNGIDSTTYYDAYFRLILNKDPSFKCGNNDDLFTLNSSSQGNKALIFSIGLISADEVAYAGGVDELNNTNYYLYTGQEYWTMSPSYYPYAYMFSTKNMGALSDWASVVNAWGIRPVINLKADVRLTGTGTATDPYRLA